LIDEALEQLKRFCDGRDVRVSVPEDLPEANVDPGMIVMVLRLLLDNALKYAAPSAAIAISAQRLEDNIMVQVSNDGPAIDPKELNVIFQKFYRGKDVRSRIPGTGLGLTIAREIVASHGGELTASSEPAGESTKSSVVRFSFTLPIAAAPIAVAPEPVAAA
jgi:signal transduction histidine kinase